MAKFSIKRNLLLAACTLLYLNPVYAQSSEDTSKVIIKCTNNFSASSKSKNTKKVTLKAKQTLSDNLCSFNVKASYFDLSTTPISGGVANFSFEPEAKINNSRVFYSGTELSLLSETRAIVRKYNGELLSETEQLGSILAVDVPGSGVIQSLADGECETISQKIEFIRHTTTSNFIYHIINNWRCSAKK